MKRKVSEQVIKRLPRYYRYLEQLVDNGILRISSQELGDMMGLTASQIRQDFNCFGGFGQQGFGYHVEDLKMEVAKILGLGRIYHMIVVGAGNIGQALTKYAGFPRDGFLIRAMFDSDSRLVGRKFKDCEVLHIDTLEEYLDAHTVDIAVLALSQAGALPMAERLKAAGVKHIWNFTPKDIMLPGLIVENASLSDTLYMLSYRMNESKASK